MNNLEIQTRIKEIEKELMDSLVFGIFANNSELMMEKENIQKECPHESIVIISDKNVCEFCHKILD